MKHKSSNAFTLTELLVIVPLAMLLGTMLLAVSNDANQQLKAAACLNNMRQWGLGFMLYANDYNDYFPYDGDANNSPCLTANTNAWFNVVPRYIGQKRLCDLLYGRNAANAPHQERVVVSQFDKYYRAAHGFKCVFHVFDERVLA
jgi:hypothetical protein